MEKPVHLLPQPFIVEEYMVRHELNKLKPRKAAGPDHISPATLKHYAGKLVHSLTYIFNKSLELFRLPFFYSIFVPVPKKSNASNLNGYRAVTLTSVIMKVFEKLVHRFLSGVQLDQNQFAYRSNRSVDDAVSLWLSAAGVGESVCFWISYITGSKK